jgi:HEAT repeat protein
MRPGSPPGTARTLLLVALALAAAVMVGSVVLMSTGSDSGAPDVSSGETPLGSGRGLRHERSAKEDDETEEPDSAGDEVEADLPRAAGVRENSRDPEGEVVVLTDADLRLALKARHWEETRRLIDALQAEGKTIPPDVVEDLMAMLAKDDLRLDAVLALGNVTDDATSRALAELAGSGASLATRQAALDALAKSPHPAALPLLQAMVSAEGADPEVLRHAVFAIAAVGGPDAGRTLIDLLATHDATNDDLRGVISTALGKAKGVDAGLAQIAREAREKGDPDRMIFALSAALMQGQNVGPELKAELRRIVESDQSLGAFESELDRQRMQAAALPAAAASGLLEPVLRLAATSGPLRDVALNALRSARGDSAAKQIAAALARTNDEKERRELASALGATGSFAATRALVELLDDPNAGIRQVAALGLSEIRDPAAVKPILEHLPKAPPDTTFGHNLIVALGTIGANESLPTLEKLAASEEAFWKTLKQWTRQAITRIRNQDPEDERVR